MRRTIASETTVEGVGLHLGVPVRLTFRPAASGAGLRFRRTDLPGEPVIPALVEHVVLTDRRTQLGEDPEAVHTVEHVLAAVVGLGIDDLEIALDGPEPPIADGSALPFVAALRRAGVVEHAGHVEYLTLTESVCVHDGASTYEAHPAEALDLAVSIEFPHPLIGRQEGRYLPTEAVFERELAAARTFGFIREVEALRAMGLIQGASTSNAVVLDERGVVETTLRWPDEFVRHKALDCVGDLALAGARVRARIVADRPSHRGTALLVRAIKESSRKEKQRVGH